MWKWFVGGAVLIGLIFWFESIAEAASLDVGDDMTNPPTPEFDAFARAIATAEGFGTPGAIPTRAHNPGDLARGDKGLGTLGAEQITVYPDDASGWRALWSQLDFIARGKSAYYTPDMTIAQMAGRWAPGAQSVAWAANVARALGATTDDIIGRWIGDQR